MRPDFSKRRRALKKLMEEKGVDALLISNHNDIYYYTGYSGLKEDRIFMLFPHDDRPKLIVTPLESEAEVKYSNTVFIDSIKDFMNEVKGFKRLGYDEKQMKVLLFKELTKLKIRLKPFGKSLGIPRITKDPWEIEQIKKAVRITKKVFESLGPLTGKSETQISNGIDILFRKHGVSNAFESIVSSGKQSAYVHHKPNERVVKKNDIVLIDIGCRVNGYCSDIGRTLCKKFGRREREIYEKAKHTHNEILENMRVGVALKELKRIHETLFKRNGFDVLHSFGHGIGLSIHDPIGGVLKENMVITVEPGIYIKNIGGFRIEDMVLVKKGKAHLLSGSITSE